MRKLTPIEEKRLMALTAQSVEACLIEPTKTGLQKSIMDATASIRNHLLEKKIHDYGSQRQGPDHKIIAGANLLTENVIIPSRASMYRPNTKTGDPRIWFKNLPAYAAPNDILALIINEGEINIINLTQVPVVEIIEDNRCGPILDLICEINHYTFTVSKELLTKLKTINKTGPHKSLMDKKTDTAIGRTLETLLGIEMNSSKKPDYKGIELKSFRSKKSRKNLFARVPNWKLSKLNSAAAILDKFGYYNDDGRYQLYCTVSAKLKNPNGFILEIDKDRDLLFENSDQMGMSKYLAWIMEDLRNALLTKHNETFWIEGISDFSNGVEYFDYKKVVHTQKPIISYFDILLEQGAITLDHTHKRLESGAEDNRGFLFKVSNTGFKMLFPPSTKYDLSS